MEFNESKLFDTSQEDDSFHIVDFESQFVEVIEELKLKCKLEVDNEKTIKFLQDIKFDLEATIADERRRHALEIRTNNDKIADLEKKCADSLCLLNEEKANHDNIRKMHEKEVHDLMEELRNINMQKLQAENQLSCIESKLRLRTNYQDSLMKKFAGFKKECQVVIKEHKELIEMQQCLKQDLQKAREVFEKSDQVNRFLSQNLEEKNNLISVLKAEVVKARTELKLAELNGAKRIEKAPKTEDSCLEHFKDSYCYLGTEFQKLLNSLTEVSKVLNEKIDEESEMKQRLEMIEDDYKALTEEHTQLLASIAKKQTADVSIQVENGEDNFDAAQIQVLAPECANSDVVLIDSDSACI